MKKKRETLKERDIRIRREGKERNEKIQESIKLQRIKTEERNKAQAEKNKLAAKEFNKLIKHTASKIRKLIKFSTSKLLFFIFLFIVQISIPIVGVVFLNSLINTTILLICSKVLALIVVIYVINSDIANEYKLIWSIIIMTLTIIGIVSYIIFGRKKMSKRKMRKFSESVNEIWEQASQNETILEYAKAEDKFVFDCANYIYNCSRMPIETCDSYEYYDIGEKYFDSVKNELAKAEKFIFLEFFIFSEGKMWNEMFEILKQKSENGVEVRLIFDDFGSLSNLPNRFAKNLIEAGIKVYCFNKVRPILDVAQNNRTHRKIIIIDGKCAFTGGLNIADEYINHIEKHGHWKDTGALIRGNAVNNFTHMFLRSWLGKFGKEEIAKFFPLKTGNAECTCSLEKTFCIPFYDSPQSRKTVCEDMYIKIIYNARDYVFINTPYLIIDEKITTALITAASSGVDVRITVPHIPDKKLVFSLTRAYYTTLLAGGVKIYEYKSGFIHAKSIVSDDKYCIIGSSNMDFRSFYLHYECDLFMCKGISADLRIDYENTCDKSILITKELAGKVNWLGRLSRSIFRLFAPLL